MADDSLQMKLFRRDAVEALGQSGLGVVGIAPAPRLSVIVCAALGIVTTIGGAAVLIEIPERVVAHGSMLPGIRPVEVLAPRSGIVESLVVGDGDAVVRGQAVLRIVARTALSASVSPHDAQRRSLFRELELLRVAAELQRDEQRLQRASIDARWPHLQQRLDAARHEAASMREAVALAKRRLRRVAALAPGAATSEHAIDELRIAVLTAEQRRHTATQQSAAVAAAAAELASERRLIETRGSALAAQRAMHEESLRRQLAQLDAATAETVSAPGSGVIAGLLARNGEGVVAGELLMSIVDPDSPLEALLYISEREGGRVVPGQRVEIQLVAFPHDRYGTLAATVAAVSSVPVQAPEFLRARGQSGNVYRIITRLDGRDEARTLLDDVPVGAPVRADVVRDRRPLVAWLLRALRRAE
ncbi:MAG: HlyD family efflux transporter periplasmic adaptor subunit [Woeseiaceae bacterium]|nr:HlyD family efflux transporter periplasmic adaptor subunit [Woeseiaceae bacterium]